jgi:hypothetical protein
MWPQIWKRLRTPVLREENILRFFQDKASENQDYLAYLGVDERKILKRVLE